MTPTDLRATAARLATMTERGAYIPKDQVGLYAEALRALAEKLEREGIPQSGKRGSV
jgi:hypothetical protein